MESVKVYTVEGYMEIDEFLKGVEKGVYSRRVINKMISILENACDNSHDMGEEDSLEIYGKTEEELGMDLIKLRAHPGVMR